MYNRCKSVKRPKAYLCLQYVNKQEHFPDLSLGRAVPQSNTKPETNTTFYYVQYSGTVHSRSTNISK